MSKRTEVQLISCESGDWYVLKVDGEIFTEGHDIHTDVWLQLLRKLGAKTTEIDITDEEMENGEY